MPSFRQRIADVGRVLRGNPLDNPAVPLSSGAGFLYDLFGASPTAAGVSVNAHSAMQLSTVYTCINILSSDISSLPLKVYERKADGTKKLAEDSDLHYLLTVEPNPEMSAVVFWAAVIGCAALRGNGYARIQRSGEAKTPVAIWPLQPHLVTQKRDSKNDLYFEVTVSGQTEQVSPADMIHIPWVTLDGWTGLDPIHSAKQVLGTQIAATKHIGAFFGNGSRPSGLLKRVAAAVTGGGAAGGKDSAKLDQVRESWEAANSGANQGRTAVLPAGWDWMPISITPEQAQILQVLQFGRTEIAGMWRIPPHMVGDTSRLSNGNHESQAIEYVKFTLRPILVRIEAEVQRKLMPTRGPKANKFFVRYDTSELERGDLMSQMQAFAVGKQWGFLNTNEIRQSRGMNSIGKIGDIFWGPLNMVPVDKLGEEPADPAADGNQEPEPAGNGGQNQRMLLERIARAYAPLFRDAAGRLTARQTRDTSTVQQIFGPVLGAIADEGGRQARQFFRLDDEAKLGEEKILRELVKTLEKRSAGWTATTVDQDSARELAYCVRSITLGLFREAVGSMAQAA